MKAILEFNLDEPEDKIEYDLAIAGSKHYRVLEDIFSWIRSKQKYTELKDNQHDILEELREFMASEINQD